MEYDGKPKFEPITGTDMQYAVNSATQVLWIDGRYYAVDDGVWFTSDSEDGPWTLADSIPPEKDQRDPAGFTGIQHDLCPRVRFHSGSRLRGLLPGLPLVFSLLRRSGLRNGLVLPALLGRGLLSAPSDLGLPRRLQLMERVELRYELEQWFLQPWHQLGRGPPRGLPSRGAVAATATIIAAPVRINTGDINIGNNINVGNRAEVARALDSRNINPDSLRSNLYSQGENRFRTVDREAAGEALRTSQFVSGRANDLYATRDGTVARQTNDQWEVRRNGSWQVPDSIERPATGDLATREISRPSTLPSVDRQTINHAANNRTANHYDFDRSSMNRARQSDSAAPAGSACTPGETCDGAKALAAPSQ